MRLIRAGAFVILALALLIAVGRAQEAPPVREAPVGAPPNSGIPRRTMPVMPPPSPISTPSGLGAANAEGGPALGGTFTVTVDLKDKNLWSQVLSGYQQCIGSVKIISRDDVCINLFTFLADFSRRVEQAPREESKP